LGSLAEYLAGRLTAALGPPERRTDGPVWHCWAGHHPVILVIQQDAGRLVLRVADAPPGAPLELGHVRFIETPTEEAADRAVRMFTRECTGNRTG
jgi:hypothetical protein